VPGTQRAHRGVTPDLPVASLPNLPERRMKNEDLIKALNEDLAGEYQAIIMYATYAASVTGPHRPMLKQFFAAEIPEELTHAQFLADKIASLGGTPTTIPRTVPETTDPRQMLQNVLDAERQAIADYKKRAEQAAALGEKGLATHLDTIVEDETSHFEETEKILRGW
jgi:bacterioferritin